MTTVRASCPDCGAIEVNATEVQAQVCVDDGRASYALVCPICRKAMSASVGLRIVDLLVESGVRLRRWRLPAELTEVHRGLPMTHEELLAFHHHLIEADDWLARLTGDVSEA